MEPEPIILADNTSFKPQDLWARIIGIPVVAVLIHLVLHSPKGPLAEHGGMKGLVFSFIYTIAYWEGLRRVWMWLQARYPHYSQTRNRLMMLILGVLLYGIFITFIIENLAAYLFDFHCGLENIIQGYAKGLIPSFLVLLVYETVYFFHSWREKVIESEAIARSQIQTQLEALKNQLDPHFLFNSLNILSSLIADNKPAQEFLDRLSDVYRYVLTSRDRNLVTLEEEMDFVTKFLYLAKVRFQEGLLVQVQLKPTDFQKMVASLSIQLLVENALKHNQFTRDNPLEITIAAIDGYIWVKNEIRPKVHLESSTRLGLSNIKERYQLLTDFPVRILQGGSAFEVGLPLLALPA